MSPAAHAAQHTTPATTSAAVMPARPEAPKARSRTEANRSVKMVMPLTGLLELPTRPTM
jgi:hypothetical protein